MSDVVIRAERLGKKYTINHQPSRPDLHSLRAEVGQQAEAIWKKARSLVRNGAIVPRRDYEEYWALKDANFEIGRGDIIGIIGRNGAGKSTLLKLLSGITEPSEGCAEIEGQVASLLEVGTGFHPELTGRENVFLNGAILGMSRNEVRKKFDEIVAFAGIEKFLDTPVKRYSSGMSVRLAFSVAAHLEPDILIIDEVLAVGDAEFQKKCLGKVEEVAHSEGRTILLVSHNISIITALCRNAVLLEGGKISNFGPVHETVSQYFLRGKATSFSVEFEPTRNDAGSRGAMLLGAQIQDAGGRPKGEIDVHVGCKVIMRYRVTNDMTKQAHVIFRFWNSEGQCAFVSTQSGGPFTRGDYQAECRIPPELLNCGLYFVDVALMSTLFGEPHYFDEQSLLCAVAVEQTSGAREIEFDHAHTAAGVLRPKLDWTIKQLT
jgi:lipopolysaccharide transport system ATP-binding protein